MALRSESYLSLAHSKQQTDSVEDKKKHDKKSWNQEEITGTSNDQRPERQDCYMQCSGVILNS